MPENSRKGTPHFQKGSKPGYGLTLSAPGEAEKKTGHPAAGKTGANYDDVARAGRKFNLDLPSRGEARITNAWSQVESRGTTGRSEATNGEIRQPENIKRFAKEVGRETSVLIASGKRAAAAVDEAKRRGKIGDQVKVVKIPHLGDRGLNSIKQDTNGNPIRPGRTPEEQRANALKRADVVAKSISDQLKKK